MNYSGPIETLQVNGNNGDDTFTVSPSSATAIDIFGGGPAAPASPGDKLIYQTPSGQTATQTVTGPDSGYIDATGGYQRVNYDEIETLVFGGDVVVNGTGDDDHMIVTATRRGQRQLRGLDGLRVRDFVAGPTVDFAGLTKLTFNGLAGDDVLTINQPAARFPEPASTGSCSTAGTQVNNGNRLTPTYADLLGDTLQIVGPQRRDGRQA